MWVGGGWGGAAADLAAIATGDTGRRVGSHRRHREEGGAGVNRSLTTGGRVKVGCVREGKLYHLLVPLAE